LLRALASACVLLLPALAAAQPIEGLYVSGNLGLGADGSLLSLHKATKIDTDVGPVGLAALGWGFGNGLRAEIEGSYRADQISAILTHRVNGSLEGLGEPGGTARTYAVMANAAYDIPVRPFGLPLQPYVGAGAGYGWLDLGNAGGIGFGTLALPDNNTFGPSPVTVGFGSAGAFAYQAIAGASWPLNILHGLDLTLEYRFFGMARTEIPVTRTAITSDTVNGQIPREGTLNAFTPQNSAVLLGLRYRFGAP
jgi:OmpA-OmpF porin, OOP family